MSADQLFTAKHTGYGQVSYVPTANEVLPERAVARATDPVTSREAAASVKGLRQSQQAVLAVLQQFGPLTDEGLIATYTNWHASDMPRQSESGIRSRRAELVRKGLVADSGERGTTASGRATVKWVAL